MSLSGDDGLCDGIRTLLDPDIIPFHLASIALQLVPHKLLILELGSAFDTYKGHRSSLTVFFALGMWVPPQNVYEHVRQLQTPALLRLSLPLLHVGHLLSALASFSIFTASLRSFLPTRGPYLPRLPTLRV